MAWRRSLVWPSRRGDLRRRGDSRRRQRGHPRRVRIRRLPDDMAVPLRTIEERWENARLSSASRDLLDHPGQIDEIRR